MNTSGKNEIESTVHYRNEVEIIIKKSEFDISGKFCLKQQDVFLTHTWCIMTSCDVMWCYKLQIN